MEIPSQEEEEEQPPQRGQQGGLRHRLVAAEQQPSAGNIDSTPHSSGIHRRPHMGPKYRSTARIVRCNHWRIGRRPRERPGQKDWQRSRYVAAGGCYSHHIRFLGSGLLDHLHGCRIHRSDAVAGSP